MCSKKTLFFYNNLYDFDSPWKSPAYIHLQYLSKSLNLALWLYVTSPVKKNIIILYLIYQVFITSIFEDVKNMVFQKQVLLCRLIIFLLFLMFILESVPKEKKKKTN